MMQWPWDRAQPDEWLPRSLRLCWGGDGGGGYSGDSGGGGWSGDGGYSGATTGGGDWGSSGSYDASGYNAGGDVSAWAGTAYDASTAGTGAGGGGDWSSFGDTNYSGMNAPNPTYADVAGPNPGVTTGGGDWGSAGTFSAAGTGGGPGGAMSFASPGGGMYGNTGGGGLFGDYGGGNTGGGGSYTGGGSYGGGGGKSSASFGEFGANFGGEGGGKSYAGSPTASPGWEPAAPSAGKGADPDAGPVGKSDAPTRSEAEVSSVPQADQDAPAAAPDADPDAGGKSDPDAGGKPDAGPDTSPSLSDGAPAGNIGGKDDAAPASAGAAAPEGSEVGAAAGVAGKGVGIDPGGEQYGVEAPSWGQSPAYQEASQQLSNMTQTALAGQDNWTGSPYANFGPDTNQAYTGPFAGPDVVGDRSSSYDGPFAGPDVVGDSRFGDWGLQQADPSQAYQEGMQALSNLTQTALDPPSQAYQGIEPGAEQYAFETGRASKAEPSWFESLISDIPGVTYPAWAQDIGKSITDINTWLSPKNQDPIFFPSLDPRSWVDAQSPMGPPGHQTYGGPFGGPDVVGNRSAPDTPSEFAPGQPGMTNFEGEPISSTGHTNFEGEPVSSTGHTNFEGEPVSSTGHTNFFEGETTPAIEAFIPGGRETDFANAAPGAIEAFIPGGRETDFAGSPAETAAQSAAAAAQQAGVSPEAAGAAASAAYAAAARGAGPAEQAEAAAAAAQQAGASPQQAMAIANSVYGQAQEGGGRPQSQGTTLGQVLDAVYGTGGPYTTPGGNVYGAHTVADIQAAVYGDNPPGMPTGNPNAPLSDDTSQGSYAATPGRASTFIPGGQVTNFEYAGSPAQQPQQAPPPGLVDMGAPGGSVGGFIPSGRPTDFTYPSSTSTGIEPGAEQYGVEVDDDNTPEPPDTPQPEDPNAPRPPGNVPGQLIGARDNYPNDRLDNPRNPFYQNSGRTNYTQGRPGVDYRTARQAGIVPNFRVGDYNVHDLDARLIANINRAIVDMERAGIPNTLTVSSAYRPATRAEAAERGMDERTSQESVYARGHAPGGVHFAAGRPGGSNHAPGRALDFNPQLSGPALTWLRANARNYGLETLGTKNGKPYDVPHIQLQGARGIANVRPNAQEQQEQRGLDAQNRQAASGRANQAAVPLPRGRPAEAPQPDVAQPRPPADIPPPVEVPAARPPPEAPLSAPEPPSRPLADIPVETRTTPPILAARTERAGIQFAQFLADMMAKSGKTPTSREEGQKALNTLAQELAKAGYPASVAQKTILETATQGSIKAGYGPNSAYNALGHVTQAINEMGATAMQGYHAGKAPETQGPPAPAPATPGKRSEAPFGGFFHFAAGGRDAGETAAIEQADLPAISPPGREEWDTPLPGGIFPGLNPELSPVDPRSGTIFSPERAGRGTVIDPDIYPLQQQERQMLQEEFDPRGWRALAKGGHVDEDEPVVVGEEGPEFFIPDQPGTVVPHMPQPGKGGKIDRWPKIPAPEYPGRFGGVEREMLRQTRNAQDPAPGLMEMIDSGRLRLNAANWKRMISDPDLIALGRSRMDDRRDGIDPGAEQFAAAPEPPTDPANAMARALGYGSIKRPPLRVGRQIY